MTKNVEVENYCEEWLRIRNTPPINNMRETLLERRRALEAVRTATLHHLATSSINWEWANHSQLNDWFSEMLSHPQKKWFVLDLFSAAYLPKVLLKDMLMAGILEQNPSANRGFIEICIREAGLKFVLRRLLHHIKHGNNREKAGAIQARYWATHNRLNEDVDDLKMEFKKLILHEFITNENLSIRMNVVPFLEPDAYPTSLHEKFLEAATIARTHENEYIRHRISMQMKDDNALKENGLLLAMAVRRHIKWHGFRPGLRET